MVTKTDVMKRLDSWGYAVVPEDDFALLFLIDAVEKEILARTNQTEVPDGLDKVEIDCVCARFLKQKHDMGLLGDDYDFTAPISSITEGDVSIAYATASSESNPESVFKAYLDVKSELPMNVLVRYRRLVW